jgi:ArsR family transcriptional regulator
VYENGTSDGSASAVTRAELCCTPLFTDRFDEKAADEVAAILKALADPVRLRLLSIIGTNETGEACACDLPKLVDRSQPTVSHHLSQLVKAGILTREQRGKWAWFRINTDTMNTVCRAMMHR